MNLIRKKDLARYDWLNMFLKRHSDFSVRKSEGIFFVSVPKYE